MPGKNRTGADSATLAALAHPLRRRLLDMLRVHGPATASTLAEQTGQAIGNVSHHLRVLGASNLIEEAPELAKDRRERWWRVVVRSLRWSTDDLNDDPVALAVADTVLSLALEQQVAAVRTWYATERDEPDNPWRSSAFSSDKWLSLTPAELQEFSGEICGVLARWAEREIPDDGQVREPVLAFAYGVPAQP